MLNLPSEILQPGCTLIYCWDRVGQVLSHLQHVKAPRQECRTNHLPSYLILTFVDMTILYAPHSKPRHCIGSNLCGLVRQQPASFT